MRRYFAVVDASHGGDDHGETLSSSLLEKDVTVALAHSLRQELESRGISTLVLRDSDANLSADQRAVFTNSAHAAIYITPPPMGTGYAFTPHCCPMEKTTAARSAHGPRRNVLHCRSARARRRPSPANYRSGRFRSAP
jgi:hypothetical protein